MVTYAPKFTLSSSFGTSHLPGERFPVFDKEAPDESRAPLIQVANAIHGAQQVSKDGLLRFH